MPQPRFRPLTSGMLVQHSTLFCFVFFLNMSIYALTLNDFHKTKMVLKMLLWIVIIERVEELNEIWYTAINS